MAKFRADLGRENNFTENGGNSRPTDFSQYKPLPDEPGLTVHNKAVIGLVAPARWAMFNPTVDEIEKYGFTSTPVFPDIEWGHLYFQVSTHRITNFSYPNGNTGFAYTVCPNEINKYLVEGLNLPPLFDTPVRCAYCEEKDRLWDVHKDAWESLGINRSDLSKDGYFDAMKKNDILQNTRDAARAATASARYILNIFDHDKFTGKRPMDEGQTALAWQSWYAPQSIYRGIQSLHTGLQEAGQPAYFDFENPAGVNVLSIVKDTTGWTKSSKIKTEYSVQNMGERYQYPADWLAYLNNDEAYADPSGYLKVLSYEEQKYYISQMNESKPSYNKKTTVDMGAARPVPPVQMQVPPAPQAPVAAPTPVKVAQVPQMPPSAPVAVAPVGPTPPPPASPVAAPPRAVAPIPTLPTAPPQPQAAPPASPVPAVGGAPIPDRNPPVGGPSNERINWDD